MFTNEELEYIRDKLGPPKKEPKKKGTYKLRSSVKRKINERLARTVLIQHEPVGRVILECSGDSELANTVISYLESARTPVDWKFELYDEEDEEF